MCLLHPVFHILLLELHCENTIQNHTQTPPLPVEVDGATEYEVSVILDLCIHHHKLQYLVQWTRHKGTAEALSWEGIDNVENSPLLVAQFHVKYPNKPGPDV